MSVGQPNGDTTRGQSAGASGAETWDSVKEDVTELAGTAAERGRTFMESAMGQATDYVDRRKGDAAQSVEDIASSLRESGRAFDDRPNIKAFVDVAADGLEQLADSIRGREFADIYADIEDAARRRPVALAAVTTVAGFMLARFLKSSAQNASAQARAYRAANPPSRQASAPAPRR
ncbi:hypothetical protein [Salinarimonas soli]|uniref:hypothetical protein n=1 Tax=Salinarimonas soli TaxID=1638099 RepID=UPI0016619C52|nr:hypothetical protein [Salinarimonas soli]